MWFLNFKTFFKPQFVIDEDAKLMTYKRLDGKYKNGETFWACDQ